MVNGPNYPTVQQFNKLNVESARRFRATETEGMRVEPLQRQALRAFQTGPEASYHNVEGCEPYIRLKAHSIREHEGKPLPRTGTTTIQTYTLQPMPIHSLPCARSHVPIPKEAHSGQDVHLYRGISVANLFGKLGDKFRCARLTRICEEKGIRSFTQCGFRPQHGTLDAIYAFLHAADSAKAKGKEHALIACLVDFEKAFDKAHRGLMLRRLSEFGVSGPFYDALVALYDKIQMVVCLNGEQGEPFDTYQGTKQGSELSPLLFGMFIEQLHELIKEKVPGAGPKFGKVNVPDITYADDVNLVVVDDAKQMQDLLNVLQLFCDLYGMNVNMKKTKLMIIRSGKLVPKHLKALALTYNGQPLSLSEQEKYLGLVMHGCKGMIFAAEQRGAVGAKAYHSMMVTVAQKGLQRPDILCDLFDKKVRPVLSYGAHIWGPYMFNRWTRDPLSPENRPEKVHTAFLRRISGMGKAVHKASLYKEYGRYPLMLQWLVLAARFWNKMADRSESALIRMAYKDNVELMLRGEKCWTWHFLKAMVAIGAIKNAAVPIQGARKEDSKKCAGHG